MDIQLKIKQLRYMIKKENKDNNIIMNNISFIRRELIYLKINNKINGVVYTFERFKMNYIYWRDTSLFYKNKIRKVLEVQRLDDEQILIKIPKKQSFMFKAVKIDTIVKKEDFDIQNNKFILKQKEKIIDFIKENNTNIDNLISILEDIKDDEQF